MSREFPEMPCQELVEVITEYVEGLMSPVDRVRFEAHLEECPPCRDYLEQYHAVIAAARRATFAEVPEPEREELREAFRAWAAQA